MYLSRRELLAGFAMLGLVGCSSKSKNSKKDETNVENDNQTEEQPKDDSPEEEAKQVFESDIATVEYAGTQDIGNAAVQFYVTNKSDVTVLVSGEGLVLNGQYDIQTLGGSNMEGIQSGHTGSVMLVFGVNVQTPLSGVADMETLDGELVLRNSDALTEEVGRVPFSVTI